MYVPNLVMRRHHSNKPHFIRTNAQGFRSNFPYKNAKSEGTKRILFLGDSYTAGNGVANEKRFSDLLGKKFGVEAYNLGLSGSGVDQQLLIYEKYGAKFKHDILVIAPHLTDISRNLCKEREAYDEQNQSSYKVSKPYYRLKGNNLILENVPVPRKTKKIEIKKKSVLNNFQERGKKGKAIFIRGLTKLGINRVEGANCLNPEYENSNDPSWCLMKRLLEQIIKLTPTGTPIILAPLPYHVISWNPNYQKVFQNLANQYENVNFVDVLSSFENIENPETLHYQIDEHYSELGHSIVADCLAKQIELLGWDSIKSQNLHKPSTGKTKKPIYTMGISALYHDSACSLIKNGKVIAACQEERFSRIKNDPNFPIKAYNYCLEEAGIHSDDIKGLAYYDNPYKSFERIIASQLEALPDGKDVWLDMLPRWLQTKLHIPELIRTQTGFQGDIFFIDHHQSHAASAFYPSPFEEAAILTVDGVGEWATATIGHGKSDEIDILKEMNYPHSLGLLYSAFTYYCGFRINEGEYKLMGLSPYGEPTYADLIKSELVSIASDGSITLNMEYFRYHESLSMFDHKLENLLEAPRRKLDSKITQHTCNVAKSIQVVTEEIMLKMATHARDLTGAENLCLAGGVALNCVANGKLQSSRIFKEIWIQPAAGDAGASYGAALELYLRKFRKVRSKYSKIETANANYYLGPSYNKDEIKSCLDSHDYRYEELHSEERAQRVASLIEKDLVVGHFSGRCEFGPRALGSRSILGDPRSENAQSVLNLKIKYRESFRPFAPAVIEKDIKEYFDLKTTSPYMLLVQQVKDTRLVKNSRKETEDLIEIVNQKRSDLPAITHVDNSARIQSVSGSSHQEFYDVLKSFKTQTGVGVLINTSFNVNGEPIVTTPKDALACFMNTEMDALIIEDFLLIKQENKHIRIQEQSFKQATKEKESVRDEQDLTNVVDSLFYEFSKLPIDGKFLNLNSKEVSSNWESSVSSPMPYAVQSNEFQLDEFCRLSTRLPGENLEKLKPLMEKIIEESYRFKSLKPKVDYEFHEIIYAMF